MGPEYENGRLHWGGCNLDEIADRGGTPLHVCSRDEAIRSAEEFKSSFASVPIDREYYFSMKTNPVPEYLRIIQSCGYGVEVVTSWELWLAGHLGFPGDKIVVTGLERNQSFCSDVAEHNPKMWALESLSQVEYVREMSGSFKNPVNIGLRICPAIPSGIFNFTLMSGSSSSPYGFLPDSSDLKQALEIVKNSGSMEFAGFHFHIGSGILSGVPYRKALSVMLKVLDQAKSLGCDARFLDIGGGFGRYESPVMDLWEMTGSYLGINRDKKNWHGHGVPGEVAREICNFTDALHRRKLNIEEILIEPGRAVSSSSHLILLTVQEVIVRQKDRRFLICDAGAMSLSNMLHVERHGILPVRESGGEKHRYKILGNMPSSLDIVSHSAHLPEMRPGDRIAVLDTGAYFVGFNNNFGGPRPGIVMVGNSIADEIRRRESFHDMISNDLENTSDGMAIKGSTGSIHE